MIIIDTHIQKNGKAYKYLGLLLLTAPVAAFISPKLYRGSSYRQQKWDIHCPEVHSSTVVPSCADIPVELWPKEAFKPKLCVVTEDVDRPAGTDLSDLCKSLGILPIDLLRLETPSDGVRGVYLNRAVEEGGVILSIPMEACLKDSDIPSWMVTEGPERTDSWVTRLGANLLDMYRRMENKPEMEHSQWLSLLPEKEYLKASLPVHWADETVLSAKSSALELGADIAFFARAEATEDLLNAMRGSEVFSGLKEENLRDMCANALDLVQTRSCRVETKCVDSSKVSTIRVLAPVFDFINHGSIHGQGDSAANAQFELEYDRAGGRRLVVRALFDLNKDEEVLVDYGDSARPAWKCLLSYGFVPHFNGDPSIGESDSVDGEHLAEVFIDGTRYEVGPSFIPFEMVERMAVKLHVGSRVGDAGDPDLALTSEIALKISERISLVAYHLLLEPETDLYDDHPAATPTPFQVISNRLSSALRWHQHRVLLACANGLKQFVDEQITSD